MLDRWRPSVPTDFLSRQNYSWLERVWAIDLVFATERGTRASTTYISWLDECHLTGVCGVLEQLNTGKGGSVHSLVNFDSVLDSVDQGRVARLQAVLIIASLRRRRRCLGVVLVVWMVDLVVEGPSRVVGAHDVISSDHFECVGVLEYQVKGTIARLSDDDFPGLGLIVLVDEEHLRLLSFHLMRARVWRIELD